MQLGSPFDALHEALTSAVATDLPDIQYWQRDWVAYRKLSDVEKANLKASDGPGKNVTRRPQTYEVEVVMFPQTWGSTALGYGGIGGSAITPAYTVLVEYHHTVCVYFGCGRLAYKIDQNKQSNAGRDRLHKDRAEHNMASCREQHRYK